ncbi:MAG TPA: hypothetical protein DHW42_05365 [Candidatus Marinimicrobia bacterium]|nr:hypothetical protein [Candidatus Neomarinimicrobiota bacterium]
MNWLALVLFSSLSIQTPLDVNPLDYEFAYGIKNDNLYIENQIERENGRGLFREEIYWKTIETKHVFVREKYVYKRSKPLRYNQIDIRYKRGVYTVGYALKHAPVKKYNKPLDSKKLVAEFENIPLAPGHYIAFGCKYVNWEFPTIITSVKVTGNIELSVNPVDKTYDIATYNDIKIGSWFIQLRYEKQGLQRDDFQFKIGFELPLRKKMREKKRN